MALRKSKEKKKEQEAQSKEGAAESATRDTEI